MKIAIAGLPLALAALTCQAFVRVPRAHRPALVAKLPASASLDMGDAALDAVAKPASVSLSAVDPSSLTAKAVVDAPVNLMVPKEPKQMATVEPMTSKAAPEPENTLVVQAEAPKPVPEKTVVTQADESKAVQVQEPTPPQKETLIAEAPKPPTTPATLSSSSEVIKAPLEKKEILLEKEKALVAEAPALDVEATTAKVEKALSSSTETMASTETESIQKEIVAQVSSSSSSVSLDTLQPSMEKLSKLLEASSTSGVSKQEILGKVGDIIGELNNVLDML
jgi:hypothetical protein